MTLANIYLYQVVFAMDFSIKVIYFSDIFF